MLLKPPFKSLVKNFALALYLNIVFISFYLIKNESIDLYIIQEHCDLYTKIHGSIAVNSCQIDPPQKGIILLSEVSIVIYKAGKHTSVENTKFIHFHLPAGTYSIDHFNAKITVLIRRQRKDWEPPQMKKLKLAKPEDYTFMASNNVFIGLGIPNDYLEKTTLIRSTLLPGSYKTSLDTSPPPISLSLRCKQTNKVRMSWMDSHHVCWPACMFLVIKQLFFQSI